ncbi:MAG: family 78 glycoside hydrolase catalytic domain [Tepidisphaeraceae bacterium]
MRTSAMAVVALLATVSLSFAADSPVQLTQLTVEHMTNPIGIGIAQPRFSWKLQSDRPGEVQTAYEIRAASTSAALANQPDLWDSGKVASDQSVLVPWAGKPLESRAIVYWQVKVWDKDGNATDWSAPGYLELGLLHADTEWKGQWITADLPRFDIDQAPLSHAMWINAGSTAAQGAGIRLVLNLPDDAKIQSAVIDAAADGLVSLYVNGKATLQGPSSHTAPFHADFPQDLTPGKNVIAIGSLAVRNFRGTGGRNAIAAHGVIDLQGGTRVEFNTDNTWKAAVVAALSGRGRGAAAPDTTVQWYAPEFDDSSWAAATVLGPYSATAVARSADPTIGPGRYLRKSFTVKGPVAKARLYATALGVYEASINGKLVSDDQLAPGWTDYFKRVMVQTYDVTALLQPGQTNSVAALLGDGWFAGRVGWMGLAQYARVGDRPDFSAQLEITYADGTTDTIATDGTWKAGPGQVVGADQQLGEVQDARKAVAWDTAGFDDSTWAAAAVDKHANLELDPQLGPPVRRLMELTPKKISHIGDMIIVDFGQNMVGHVRLTGTGPAGATVQILHGEMLNPDGTVYNENLRQAISFDSFTFAGTGSPETFEPHFTFHGFRYAQITGYPGDLTADNIRGIVVGSDTPDTGHIVTSNADVNQLISNIRWGQRGNFLSVPTDCPQRDERMGWMGDAQVFSSTAVYNADVSGFFAKWMVDVDDGQTADGAFGVVSPRLDTQTYPIWGDAGVIIPWVSYTAYGDKAFLEKNYDNMTRWVDHCQQQFPTLLESGGVGDNLSPLTARGGPLPARGARGPTTGPAGARGGFGAGGFAGGGRGGFGGGPNATSVLDTAYFAHSAQICAKAAAILGKTDDAAKYDKLFHDIDDAFVKAYVHDDGSMVAGNQSTYVVALQFGLIPDRLRDGVAKHLTDDVTTRGHLSTGFVGVGYLNPALSAIGRTDLAYQLLLTDTYPSWLFPVKEGATTIWERWDGYTPDRGFQASSMNSFNHYSLGAVGKWLYNGAGGIVNDEEHPGFKHFFLNPQMSTKFTSYKATFDSPYGVISSDWRIGNGQVTYDVIVPPNTTATLTLPASGADLKATGAPVVAADNGQWTLAAGSYEFTFPATVLK